jgi:hypothetical protein
MANFLPWASRIRVFVQIRETTFQFSPVAFRQRHGVGFGSDGVPDRFREIDPFGDAELGRFGEEALGHASDFTPCLRLLIGASGPTSDPLSPPVRFPRFSR